MNRHRSGCNRRVLLKKMPRFGGTVRLPSAWSNPRLKNCAMPSQPRQRVAMRPSGLRRSDFSKCSIPRVARPSKSRITPHRNHGDREGRFQATAAHHNIARSAILLARTSPQQCAGRSVSSKPARRPCPRPWNGAKSSSSDPSCEEPMVRIHLPPAVSPYLLRRVCAGTSWHKPPSPGRMPWCRWN